MTTASAHSGGFEQHISYDALNSADAKIVLTERPPGRTERRESWNTSIDSAASGRLASNHDKSWTRGEAEGAKRSEDYDASPGQPENGNGSIDNTGPITQRAITEWRPPRNNQRAFQITPTLARIFTLARMKTSNQIAKRFMRP